MFTISCIVLTSASTAAIILKSIGILAVLSNVMGTLPGSPHIACQIAENRIVPFMMAFELRVAELLSTILETRQDPT